MLAGGETGAFQHRWEHRGAMPAETFRGKPFGLWKELTFESQKWKFPLKLIA
jgi:hypothetical protein